MSGAGAARPGAATEFTRWCAMPTIAAFASSRLRSTYPGMHRMLGIALKGVPRESYKMMSKITTQCDVDPQRRSTNCGRLARRSTSTSCCCIVQHTCDVANGLGALAGGNPERRREETILAMGLGAWAAGAATGAGNKWLEVAMIRVNHNGTRMDARGTTRQRTGNVDEVVPHVQQARKQGMGVISMKLVGEGTSSTARTGRRRCGLLPERRAWMRDGGL